MIRHILPLIPEHTTYIEPFAGGASLFFAKPPSKGEVLNDLNDCLVAFYRVLSCPAKSESLIQQLEATPYSHSVFKEAGRIMKDPDADELSKAWAVYYRYNNSFAKAGRGFAFDNSENPYPNVYQARLTRLSSQRERLKNVAIECIDAVELIKKYDSPTAFFYCDPPYPETNQTGYKHRYTVADFMELVATLREIKGSFILSCYPMANMPTEWEQVSIATSAGTAAGKHGGDSARTECLWLGGNYKHMQQRLF